MIQRGYLNQLPFSARSFVAVFIMVLSVGYASGLAFVDNTTSSHPSGIVENYNGNEENEEAEEMKFKKSDHEMLNIVHTHILSMSIIFFILGSLVYGTRLSSRWQAFLMIEPLLSVLVTFGGIFLLWRGHTWMVYVVMVSGALMTISFVLSSLMILYNCLKPHP